MCSNYNSTLITFCVLFLKPNIRNQLLPCSYLYSYYSMNTMSIFSLYFKTTISVLSIIINSHYNKSLFSDQHILLLRFNIVYIYRLLLIREHITPFPDCCNDLKVTGKTINTSPFNICSIHDFNWQTLFNSDVPIVCILSSACIIICLCRESTTLTDVW